MSDKETEHLSPFDDHDPFPGLETELDGLIAESQRSEQEEPTEEKIIPAAEQNGVMPEHSEPGPAPTNPPLHKTQRTPEPSAGAKKSPSGFSLLLALLLATGAVASTFWVLEDPEQTPFSAVKKTHPKPTSAATTTPATRIKQTSEQKPADDIKPAQKQAPEQASVVPPVTEKLPEQKPQISTPSSRSAESWVLNLASMQDRERAIAYQKQLALSGVETEVFPVQIKGKTWYRVRVSGIPGKSAAIKKKARLNKQLGLTSTWVGKR